jgi:hypothetical protein
MSNVTFKAARETVLAQLKREWGDTGGTPIALRTGYQNDTHWQVVAGAREYLVGNDDDFALFDAPVWLVDKATGEITKASVIEDDGHLAEMVPAR